MWLMSDFILRELKVNEKIWKGIDEGIYKQDSEEMTLAWQEAITEASKESLKVGIHGHPGSGSPVCETGLPGLWNPGKDYLINELSEVHLSKDAVVRLFPIVDYF